MAVPRNGAEQGVARTVANTAQEVPGEIMVSIALQDTSGDVCRQPDLEQIPEIASEQRAKKRKKDEKDRVLELYTPTGRQAGRLCSDDRSAENQNGEQDARRRRQKAEANVTAGPATLAHDAQQLDCQHG